VTSGRKSVVGRPILYRTSKDFLVHFGLKDVGELPSLKEFEELAKRALGSEWATGEPPAAAGEATAAPRVEAGVTAIEGGPETPPEALPPVAETGGAVLEPVPETSPEVVPPIAEAAAPLEVAVETEPAPAAAEESGAVSMEEPAVPAPDPEPPVAVETASQDESAATPDDSEPKP
jgi:segregation and condensation protein B